MDHRYPKSPRTLRDLIGVLANKDSTHQERANDTRGAKVKIDEDTFTLTLTTEDLVNITWYDDSAEVYAEFLQAVKSNATVTQLTLNLCAEGYSEERFFPILNKLCRHLPKADRICIDLWQEQISIDVLLSYTKHFKSVCITTNEDGSLFACRDKDHHDRFDPEHWGLRVLKDNPNLETLRFRMTYECAKFSEFCASLVMSLPSPSHLKELSLHVTMRGQSRSMDASFFNERVLDCLHGLVHASCFSVLSLRLVKLANDDQWKQLAQVISGSSIEDLALDLQLPQPESQVPLVDAMTQLPKLQKLSFTLNLPLRRENPKDIIDFPVATILNNAPHLESLVLEMKLRRSLAESDQWRNFVDAMQSPTCRLKRLSLSESDLVECGSILSILSPESTLEELHGSMNDPFDLSAWLSYLPDKPLRLKSVDFECDSEIVSTSESEARLLNAISKWYHLVEFHLDDFAFSEDTNDRLKTLLVLNRAGRKYLASPTASKADGVEVLVKVRTNLDALYTHLQENPCLCTPSMSAIEVSSSLGPRLLGLPLRKKA